MEALMMVVISFIIVYIILYRKHKGEKFSAYVTEQIGALYEKYAPYSFKEVRGKVKDLGQEYTTKQYLFQIAVFGIGFSVLGYLYFYNIVTALIYGLIAICFVPYFAYLRCKRLYSEFIFEQIQVYTTNVIMEFATTQAFVKSLEGVYSSGVLEDPVKSDVKVMIDMSYANGTIDAALEYMNSKYDFFIVRNMHQIFLQITNEGSRDAGESLENMSQDIDMLVESVYRDRIDRASFYKKFLQFGIVLYLMVMLVQFILGVPTYIENLKKIYMVILLHGVVFINTLFLVSGTKFYNENVGAE
jgi:hypothetical protein